MNALMEMKGRLDLVVSRGWMSTWEASVLEAGAVAIGDSTRAGQPAEITFNGRFIGRGSVLVLGAESGDCAAVRIEELEREELEAPEPDRGSELIELLPFDIVWPGCSYSLDELRSAAIGTALSLDSPVGKNLGPEDGTRLTLMVAGHEAAAGRLVVVGESFGLLLDECLPASSPDCEPRPTGAVLKPGHEHPWKGKPKLYDWRRPDCFTRRQIDAMAIIHERAIEVLGGLCPEFGGFKLSNVDQMTYGELLASLSAECRILSTAIRASDREPEHEAGASLALRRIIQPAEPHFRISKESEALAESRSRRSAERRARRPVLAFAERAAAPLVEYGDYFVRALRAGWRQTSDLNFETPRIEASAPLVSVEGSTPAGSDRGIPADDMICLISFECPNGRVNLAYAATGLYPVWKVLERHGR